MWGMLTAWHFVEEPVAHETWEWSDFMNIELAGIVQSILTTPVHQIKLGSKPVFQVIHIFQYSCVKVFARAKLTYHDHEQGFALIILEINVNSGQLEHVISKASVTF